MLTALAGLLMLVFDVLPLLALTLMLFGCIAYFIEGFRNR